MNSKSTKHAVLFTILVLLNESVWSQAHRNNQDNFPDVSSPGQTNFDNDDFEYNDSLANHGWIIESGNPHTTSDPVNPSNRAAYLYSQDLTANPQFRRDFGELTLQPDMEISIKFFDTEDSCNNCDTQVDVFFDANSKRIGAGWYNNPSRFRYDYGFPAWSGHQWEPYSLRGYGWHTFRWVVDQGLGIDLYIDDQLIIDDLKGPGGTPATTLSGIIVSGGSDRTSYSFYVDDFVLHYGSPLYVALGDSYSSGEGAGDYAEGTDKKKVNKCRRSEVAWTSSRPGGDAPLALPGFEFMSHVSAACSGANIDDLTIANNAHHPDWTKWEIAQLDNPNVPNADMITLTIGGNDIHFGIVVKYCLFLPNCYGSVPWGPSNGTLASVVSDAIADLRIGQLANSYLALKAKSPGTPIFVAGYPLAVPLLHDIVEPGCAKYNALFPIDETIWIRQIGGDLNDAVGCAAAEAGVHFVPVADHFARHEACSALGLDWINSVKIFNSHESFHPNKRGQREYARAVQKKIGSSPDLEQNPGPRPGACGPTAVSASTVAATPLPSMGDLNVVASAPPECEDREADVVAGENVGLMGWDFAPEAAVELEVRFEDETGAALGTVAADAGGVLDATVTVPASAPSSGATLFLASGQGADGAARLLLGEATLGASSVADTDGDGVPNVCDNCPDDANGSQADSDGDGQGDACDDCPSDRENDIDGDGVCDDIDPCIDIQQLVLQGDTVTATRTESACQTVTATLYEVTDTGNVTFIAGERIVLGDGFRVSVGGRFTAVIGAP